MIKKLFTLLVAFGLLTGVASASVSNNFFYPTGTNTLLPTTQYNELGSAVTPLGAVHTTNLFAYGNLTFGTATMTGNLNMGGFNILNARNVYMDADSNSGVGSSADNVIDIFANGLSYLQFGINTMSFRGGAPVISTISNTMLTLDPNGTGIIKLGDTALTSLSSLSTNGTLTYDLEVLNNLLTGGITMATNGGDVPFMDRSVTSASPIGTAQSYPIQIDGQFILTPYSESDGAGGLQNKEVRTVAIRNYGRLNNTQGVDVASDTNIVLTTGNVFEITGTTKIDLISNLGWQEGAMVTLICNESVTIDHGTATSGTNITIMLAGSSDFACTANDTLGLVLSSTTAGGQAWREVSRTAI